MANCNHGPLQAPMVGNTPVGICTKQHVEVAVIHSYHPVLQAISTSASIRYHIPFISLYDNAYCHSVCSLSQDHCWWRLEVGGWRVGPTLLPGTLLIYYSFVIILLLPVRSPVFPLLGAFPALLVLSYEHCWWKLEVGGRNPTVPWALLPYLAAVTLYPIAHSSSVVHPASSSCVVFLLSSSRFLSLSCILLLVHPLVCLIAHSSLLALSFVILLLRLVVSSCFLPLSSSTMLSLLCYASCQCLLGIIV